MIQELAASGDATLWSVASLLFFVAAFGYVVYRIVRMRRTDADAAARLPLEDGSETDGAAPGNGPREPGPR